VIARSTHTTKRTDRNHRRSLARLVDDFPDWTIVWAGPLWEAARDQDGAALTLTAPTPRQLRAMLTAVDEPDRDDTGAVPVTTNLPGGDR
jgi:hypothetical protein